MAGKTCWAAQFQDRWQHLKITDPVTKQIT